MRAACERKVATMEGLVLSRNAAMLRFARGLGFEIQPVAEDLTTMRIAKELQSKSRPQSSSTNT